MEPQYDLIPYPNQIKTLFVLESPHINEVDLDYPAAGQTGKNMSRVILGDNSTAFGKLLFDKSPLIADYGIFNSCHFPLGISTGLSPEQMKIAALKNVPQTKNKYENYHLLNEVLNKVGNLDAIINYKTRLAHVLNNSSSIELIVVCGFIAQAIFLKLYPSIPMPPYNKKVDLPSRTDTKRKLLFVNHPSEISSPWVFRLK